MTLLRRLRAWSHRRQLLGRSGPDLAGVLHAVIAVYSVHPTAPLSLAARVAGFDPDAFLALDRAHAFVRIPAMRTSGHLVPRDTLPQVWAATRRPMARHAWRLRDAGIGRDAYEALCPAVLAAAATPRTARELRADVGFSASLSPILQTLVFEGRLVGVGPAALRSSARHYVTTEAALGGPIPPADRGAALAWLATAYLRAFGPARVEDFAWWAALRPSGAAAVLGTLDTVDVGEGHLLLAADADAFAAVEPVAPGALDLLPKWDAYSMGYRRDGRARLIDPHLLPRALDKDHNMRGLVLEGGAAIGVWSMRSTVRRLDVDLDLFHPAPPDLEAHFERVAAALGVPALRITPRP